MRKIVLIQTLVLVTVCHLGCAANQVDKKSLVLDAMSSQEIVATGQFNIQFDPRYEANFFEQAWSILEPKIDILGPKSNGLMTLTVGASFETAEILRMIESTKGVILAEPAFVYEPKTK